MSNDKADKLFFDEKTGILHGSECPKTKKEFHAPGGSDECKFERALEEVRSAHRAVGPLRNEDACSSGPAKVASKDYREGWDRIFGTKPTVGQA